MSMIFAEFWKLLGVSIRRNQRRAGVWMYGLAFCLGTSPLAMAQEPTTVDSDRLSEERREELRFDRDQYLAAFDQVWQTVLDTHWDADLMESVWLPAREKYLARMQQAQSRANATRILQEMLIELKQSHFHILPAEVYAKMDAAAERGGEGWSGITFRVVSDEFVVTHVASDSPAAKAGIEVGWVLEKIQRSGDRLHLGRNR